MQFYLKNYFFFPFLSIHPSFTNKLFTRLHLAVRTFVVLTFLTIFSFHFILTYILWVQSFAGFHLNMEVTKSSVQSAAWHCLLPQVYTAQGFELPYSHEVFAWNCLILLLTWNLFRSSRRA